MSPQELLSYLPALPMYFVWLIGGIVALVRWHRHPRVSLIMLIATALFISSLLLNVVGFRWVNQALVRGWSTGDAMYVLTGLRIIVSLLNAAAYTLLLVAVFGWRGGRRPGRDAEEDFPEDPTPPAPPRGA